MGGVVGGVAVLVAIAAFVFIRRRRRQDSLNDPSEIGGNSYAPNEMATDKNMTELPGE